MVQKKKPEDSMLKTLGALDLITKKVGRTTALTFLFVSQNEGLAQSEIAKAVGRSQATVAKHLRELRTGKYGWKVNGKPMEVREGLGLLEVRRELSSNAVRAPVYLTEKGKRLIAGAESLLD